MSIQTSMTTTPAAAYAGMVSETVPGFKDLISKVSANASITNGVFVIQGASDDGECDLPSASGDVTAGIKGLGVAIFDPTLMTTWPPGTTSPYPVGQAVAVLRRGRIWVAVEEAVNAGDQAYVRYSSGGGGTQLGAFRKSADTATAAALKGSRYMTTTTGAGLALLEINLVSNP